MPAVIRKHHRLSANVRFILGIVAALALFAFFHLALHL
jgi:hypothetical protein